MAKPENSKAPRSTGDLRLTTRGSNSKNYILQLTLEPDFASAYNNRGLTYENKGEIDIKDYNMAIELTQIVPLPITIAEMFTEEKGSLTVPSQTIMLQ